MEDFHAVVALDGGAGTCKGSVAALRDSTTREWTLTHHPCKEVPCMVCRSKRDGTSFIADEFLRSDDLSTLTLSFPFDRGFPVDFAVLGSIWSRLFSGELLRVNPKDSCLCLSTPVGCPDALLEDLESMVFDYFQFKALCRKPGPVWAFDYIRSLYEEEAPGKLGVTMIVDSGFSATTVIPFVGGQMFASAVRRVNVGGKLLTNYLKEVLSFRSVNLMDETLVVTDMKEKMSFVSLDFDHDLERLRPSSSHCMAPSSGMVMPKGPGDVGADVCREYVLSSSSGSAFGDLRLPWEPKEESDEVIPVGIERFTVPELLFNPTDAGLQQGGVVDAIQECLDALPEDIAPFMLENVVLVGGHALMPGFQERLVLELQKRCADGSTVRILPLEEGENGRAVWQGIQHMATVVGTSAAPVVSRMEFSKQGHALCRERFGDAAFEGVK